MNFNMNNFQDKMMSRFFRKVDNVCWDLSTGKIGIMTEDGIASICGEGEDAQIEVNMFEQLGFPVPAFAQSTPVDSVTVGDLIYGDSKAKGWVVEVVASKTKDKTTPKKFKIMTPSGTTTTWTPPKVSMLGFESGVMVLRSLVNMLPGGKSGVDNMMAQMMPLMMMGGGDIDFDKIMPMMLFSQVGSDGSGAGANPGMGSNMIQAMMMAQMFSGSSKPHGMAYNGPHNRDNFFDNNKNRR